MAMDVQTVLGITEQSLASGQQQMTGVHRCLEQLPPHTQRALDPMAPPPFLYPAQPRSSHPDSLGLSWDHTSFLPDQRCFLSGCCLAQGRCCTCARGIAPSAVPPHTHLQAPPSEFWCFRSAFHDEGNCPHRSLSWEAGLPEGGTQPGTLGLAPATPAHSVLCLGSLRQAAGMHSAAPRSEEHRDAFGLPAPAQQTYLVWSRSKDPVGMALPVDLWPAWLRPGQNPREKPLLFDPSRRK